MVAKLWIALFSSMATISKTVATTAVYGSAALAPGIAMAATGALTAIAIPVALLLGLVLAALVGYFASARALFAGRVRAACRPGIAASAAAVGAVLVLAPSAAAHDVVLRFDVDSVSARTSGGTVAGDVPGSLTTQVRARRLPRERRLVRMTWNVEAGERSFTARLRGIVNLRTRRAMLDGRVVSGFSAGAVAHARGRLRNVETGRLVGTLTLVPHAARIVASRTGTTDAGGPAVSGANCDPCVFVSVVRYGEGRVTSPLGIDCGTTCSNLLSSGSEANAVLTATGASFSGWKDCPSAIGNQCLVPFSGAGICVHAYFTADRSAAPSAGSCGGGNSSPPAPPAPSPTVDGQAPNTVITAAPRARTATRNARFSFRASEAGARFLCRLDARAWVTCRPPRAYRRLTPGGHVFRVAAVDAAGNRDATPATRRWVVRGS
jgi:hypothetical protein